MYFRNLLRANIRFFLLGGIRTPPGEGENLLSLTDRGRRGRPLPRSACDAAGHAEGGGDGAQDAEQRLQDEFPGLFLFHGAWG